MRRVGMTVQTIAIGWLLLAGCVVTRAPRLDERPRWRTTGAAAFDAGCLLGRAFVRKSGKQGMGVALQLRSRRDCAVAFDRVTLALGERAIPITSAQLAPLALAGRSLIYAWLPVAFDNNAAWNAGQTRATLELAMTVDGAPATWRIAMEQR